jgi:hypothetical protein
MHHPTPIIRLQSIDSNRSTPIATRKAAMTMIPLPANAARQAGPERVFTSWASQHQRQNRLWAASLAQISRHHDLNPAGDATHQMRAWALRQARAKHLHDSAIAQLRASEFGA